MTTVRWAGELSLFDLTTKSKVAARAFGSFEGTISEPDGDERLRELILPAVQQAAAKATAGGSVLGLMGKLDEVAAAALAQLGPRLDELGAVGELSIVGINFAPDDVDRIRAAATRKT